MRQEISLIRTKILQWLIFALHRQKRQEKLNQSPVKIPQNWHPETGACVLIIHGSSLCESGKV